jgi:hypothetical protein
VNDLWNVIFTLSLQDAHGPVERDLGEVHRQAPHGPAVNPHLGEYVVVGLYR